MKRILILAFMVMLLSSCGRKQDAVATQSRSFELARENFFNNLKNPDQVANSLMPGMSKFDSTMLSNPEIFYHYTSNTIIAAANLGIYISDLNYCILFRNREMIKKYFQATYELGKSISIEKGTLEFLVKRYEENIERNDSLNAVVNQLLSQSTLGLAGTDHERLAGVAMAGYQIENLHLALTTLQSFSDVLSEEQIQTQKQLLQLILDQRGKFETLYNFIRANSDPLDPDANPNYPFFDHALRELIGVFQGVSESDPQINELREKVEAIRDKIVQR